jgi:hypothetical protein
MKYPHSDAIIWQFHTARFRVVCHVDNDEINPADSFEFPDDIEFAREGGSHWFVAFVSVWYQEDENDERLTYLAHDCLGGCSYRSFDEFVSSHRDRDPMNRNCTIMRADYKARTGSDNVSICHYFPSMVSEAITAARKAVERMHAIPLHA